MNKPLTQLQDPHSGDPPRLSHAIIRRHPPPTQNHRPNLRRRRSPCVHPQANAVLLPLAGGCRNPDLRRFQRGHTVESGAIQAKRKDGGTAAGDQGGERDWEEGRWEAEFEEFGEGREVCAGAGEEDI